MSARNELHYIIIIVTFVQICNNNCPTICNTKQSNLITVQQDATYSVYYISVGISTCFGC